MKTGKNRAEIDKFIDSQRKIIGLGEDFIENYIKNGEEVPENIVISVNQDKYFLNWLLDFKKSNKKLR